MVQISHMVTPIIYYDKIHSPNQLRELNLATNNEGDN